MKKTRRAAGAPLCHWLRLGSGGRQRAGQRQQQRERGGLHGRTIAVANGPCTLAPAAPTSRKCARGAQKFTNAFKASGDVESIAATIPISGNSNITGDKGNLPRSRR
jgi:hypothetical protein